MQPTNDSKSHLIQTGGSASLALAILLASLGTSIAYVALPILQTEFGASFQLVQWTVLSYLLAITVVIAAADKLADIYGPKKLFLHGVVLFGAGSIACAAAGTLEMLIAARAVQGIGAATMIALSMALTTRAVSKERSGKAIAMLGTMSAIGTAAGPVIGGLLLSTGYWPAIFIFSLPIAVITFWLGTKYLPKDNVDSSNAQSFDVLGAVTLAIALGAYSLAMTLNRPHWGQLNMSLLCFSIATLILFVQVQRTSKSPLIRVSLFSQPEMRLGFTLNAWMVMVMMTTLVVGPFYLSYVLNLSPSALGLVVAIGPVSVALTGPFAGHFVDKLGVQTTTQVGLCLVIFGSTLFAVLPSTTGGVGYSLSILFVNVGYSLFQNSNNASLMVAAANERGLVSALLHLSGNLGLVSGASLMGGIFICITGSDNMKLVEPDRIAVAMQTTFAVTVVIMLLTLTSIQRKNSTSEKV